MNEFDDLTWMLIELDILHFAAEDMFEGTPLDKQITEDHIIKGIKHWFEKDGVSCSDEVAELVATGYKEYCQQRDGIEKFCRQFLEALLPASICR